MTDNQNRVFDWAPRHDPRSKNFPIRGAAKAVPVKSKAWKVPDPLDQGYEGACVGYGWTHEALSTPVPVDFKRVKGIDIPAPDTIAKRVYREAQVIDEWEGENYEGTSVNAGAKVMRTIGVLKEWRWAFGIADVIHGVLTTGPVVLGIPWYEDMYEAPEGIVHVGGELVGGHCILARAVAERGRVFPDEEAVGWLNSWGPTYGKNGLAWIRASDLSFLLRQDGEAAVPFRRSYGR